MKSENPEDKENILNAARDKKQVIYKRFGVTIILDFATVILEARLKWSSVFKVLRENDYRSIFPYGTIIPSKWEGRISKVVFSNE